MKNRAISQSMKEFWNNKSQEFLEEVNKKRSSTLKNTCIWLKKEGEKPFPCKLEMTLSKLSEGYLIVNTIKNKEKVFSIFGEIPEYFWANKNK